jgi:hypothetical protein
MRIEGEGLTAEVCALYLAGAGVRRLEVPAPLVSRCRALNSEVDVASASTSAFLPARVSLSIRGGDGRELGRRMESDTRSVRSGAALARWALETVLERVRSSLPRKGNP